MTTEANRLLGANQQLDEKDEDFHIYILPYREDGLSPKDRESLEKGLRRLARKFKVQYFSLTKFRQQ